MANSDSLTNVGVNALSKFLVPLTEQNIAPIVFDDVKSYETETVEFKVPDMLENLFKMTYPSSLCKLEFNGTFDDTFNLVIAVDGNILSRYKAPYRFVLKVVNTIEFHVPPVCGTLELIVTGFTGIIKAGKSTSPVKNSRFFSQYSGRSVFIPLTTDLMVSSDNPIESVMIRVGLCNRYDTTHSTIITFDSNTLDAMYTKFTGKQERPKNFAICTIKNKELRFTPYLEIKEILANEVTINKSAVHYHTYDLFIFNDGYMVNRYSY